MGNGHSFSSALSGPITNPGTTLTVTAATGIHEVKATEAGLREGAQSIPGLPPNNVQTIARTSLNELVAMEAKFIKLFIHAKDVGVVRYDVWITRKTADKLLFEWAQLTAVLPVEKFKEFRSYKDGHLTNYQKVAVGLTASDTSLLTNFITTEIDKISPSKTATNMVLAVTPPKITPPTRQEQIQAARAQQIQKQTLIRQKNQETAAHRQKKLLA